MKLVVDFRMHNASGIGTYLKNILPYLTDMFDVVLLANSLELTEYPWIKKVKIIQCRTKIYSFAEQWELFRNIPSCDIFWGPHYNIPLLPIKAKKRVVTLHDVYHLAFYNTLNFTQKLYAKIMIHQAINKSNKVITVSNFSCEEIKKYTNTTQGINVIYNAVDLSKFRVIQDPLGFSDIRLKYQLPKDFILFIGNVKPHKNLTNLLLALKNIKQNIVIVGEKDKLITLDGGLAHVIEENDMGNKVFFTGYIKEMDVSMIYNMATLFVFPSHYEGFGLPVLEAMACGTPVVCSYASSLPEVGGDAVIYCNPHDTEDIKKNIELVLYDETLQQQLISKGLKRARMFSWEQCAKQHIEVFHGVLN
jgi:glycosyltransferase involved in cell wall biosynthesis